MPSASEIITQSTAKLSLSAEDPNNKRIKSAAAADLKEIKKRLDGKSLNYELYGLKVEVTEDGIIQIEKEERKSAKYRDWLPTWNPTEKYEPYTVFDWEDRGLKADPEYKNLFQGEFQKKDIAPKFGTEVRGIQLSQLSEEAKDDLAKYVADRGVVVFRDQDLADKGPEFAVKFGESFGPQHIHPTSGAPSSTSKIHLVYKPENGIKPQDSYLKSHTRANFFHSDISYEKQPPSITFLGLLEGPVTGGDTVFVDTVQAYERLSPQFQQILESLRAIHQGVKQADHSRETLNIIRREPVSNSHPIVRTISSTGKKAIYVNGFVSEIEGLKIEESQVLLQFLFEHLHTSADLQIRASWEPGTVVVWDNRRTEHSALFDWDSNERRHLFRITPRAEVPYLEK